MKSNSIPRSPKSPAPSAEQLATAAMNAWLAGQRVETQIPPGAISVSDMADQTGLSESQMRKLCKREVQAGRMTKHPVKIGKSVRDYYKMVA